MGRHSAPDDEERVVTAVAPPVASRPRPGRHARPDDGSLAEQDTEPLTGEPDAPVSDQVTERIAVPEVEPDAVPDAEPEVEPEVESEAAPEPGPAQAPVAKGTQSTAADLALLREHSDVRARVIAAVVAPFVVYTAVMYLAGALNVYFVWAWLPLVTAGVLGGSILDAAHRRRVRGERPPD
jgi:hypothetical protein